MTLRRVPTNLDPPPEKILTEAELAPEKILTTSELARAEAWRARWGALAWTREPGADPKSGLNRVLLRLNWEQIPLVELGGQRCYSWLKFLAWRRDHEGLRP